VIRGAFAIVDGWFVVPYGGRDLSTVHIGFGPDPAWHPAFLDYHGDQRVAKVRVGAIPAARRVPVWLRVDGAQERVGTIN
jgi:hypothetical protein